MKYLKTFEDKNVIKKYWLLPTDERFEQSLKDIKCPKSNIKRLLSSFSYYHLDDDEKYVYISYDNTEVFTDNYWGCDPFYIDEFNNGDVSFNKDEYKFIVNPALFTKESTAKVRGKVESTLPETSI